MHNVLHPSPDPSGTFGKDRETPLHTSLLGLGKLLYSPSLAHKQER